MKKIIALLVPLFILFSLPFMVYANASTDAPVLAVLLAISITLLSSSQFINLQQNLALRFKEGDSSTQKRSSGCY